MNFEALHSAIESPSLKAVAAHWQAARSGSEMPSWQRLRPSQIAQYLSIVWAYRFDRINRQFIGRLAGDRISECFGKNFRGARLQDIHPPHGFEISHAAMSKVALTPAIYLNRGPLFDPLYVYPPLLDAAFLTVGPAIKLAPYTREPSTQGPGC